MLQTIRRGVNFAGQTAQEEEILEMQAMPASCSNHFLLNGL